MRSSVLLASLTALGLTSCAGALPEQVSASVPLGASARSLPSASASQASEQAQGAERSREPIPRATFGADHRPSEFVRTNPDLFSDQATQRPWPKVGTPEWQDQQDKDARKEKHLEQAIKICREC